MYSRVWRAILIGTLSQLIRKDWAVWAIGTYTPMVVIPETQEIDVRIPEASPPREQEKWTEIFLLGQTKKSRLGEVGLGKVVLSFGLFVSFREGERRYWP